MTTYMIRAEASADGEIWQALDTAELIDLGDLPPAQWVDAADVAVESGASPGSWTRVLVWPADIDTTNATAANAIHVDEHHTPAPAPTQRHEIEAWLGDDHGLTEDQIADLTRAADEIAARYPDPDDREDREAALTVAYRLMVEDAETVVRELAEERRSALVAAARAAAGLQQAAVALVDIDGGKGLRGVGSQMGFARAASVDRATVRDWLGI